jgi:NADP-dependent 3-hydroxy acid dehydrogenase YdfG
MVAEGATVYAASRRASPRAEPAVRTIRADVSDYGSVCSALRLAAAEGPLDFVVNSAGIGLYAPLRADHSAQWREILETNLLGTVHVCSAILEHAPALDQFVLIGSLAGYRLSRTPGNAVYSAAKAAGLVVVEHFRSLLREQGSTMRVSVVSPGFVEGTEFESTYFAHAPEAARPLYTAGENLLPGDVADLVAYVLSSDGRVDINELVVRPTRQPD